jgi:hypothetical protein
MRTGMASSQCQHPCLAGVVSNSWMTCWARGSFWSNCESGEWSERNELVLGRSSTNRHENGHDIFPMLASTFGGCSEQRFHDLLGTWLFLVETWSQGSWSERDELVLRRSLNPPAVAHRCCARCCCSDCDCCHCWRGLAFHGSFNCWVSNRPLKCQPRPPSSQQVPCRTSTGRC